MEYVKIEAILAQMDNTGQNLAWVQHKGKKMLVQPFHVPFVGVCKNGRRVQLMVVGSIVITEEAKAEDGWPVRSAVSTALYQRKCGQARQSIREYLHKHLSLNRYPKGKGKFYRLIDALPHYESVI